MGNGVPKVLPTSDQLPSLLSIPELAGFAIRICCYVRERLQHFVESRFLRVKPLRYLDACPQTDKASNPPVRPQPPGFARHLLDGIIRSDASIDESRLRYL